MTMLLGAAAILKRLEVSGELKGTVRIMFQPAEEGGAGGKRMREEGVLEKYPPVQHAFALHDFHAKAVTPDNKRRQPV